MKKKMAKTGKKGRRSKDGFLFHAVIKELVHKPLSSIRTNRTLRSYDLVSNFDTLIVDKRPVSCASNLEFLTIPLQKK